MAHLAQALQFDAQGHPEQAAAERALALEAAPTGAGQINEQRFEWIADADSRLGPVLEVVINGRYDEGIRLCPPPQRQMAFELLVTQLRFREALACFLEANRLGDPNAMALIVRCKDKLAR